MPRTPWSDLLATYLAKLGNAFRSMWSRVGWGSISPYKDAAAALLEWTPGLRHFQSHSCYPTAIVKWCDVCAKDLTQDVFEWRCVQCPGRLFCCACKDLHENHNPYMLQASVRELHALLQVRIDNSKRDPANLVCHAFDVYQESPFIVIPGSSWLSYKAFKLQLVRLGTSRRKGGAILCGHNSVPWVRAYLSCVTSGLAVILVDPINSGEQGWNDAVNACQAAQLSGIFYVFAEESAIEAWQDAAAPGVQVNCLEENSWETFANATEIHAFQDDSSPVSCLFTSGSTGRPKAMWFSGAALRARGITSLKLNDVPYDSHGPDGFALLTPLFHSNGFWTLWRALLRGALLGMIDVRREDVLEAIGSIAPSGLTGVPKFWELVQLRFQQELACSSGDEKRAYQATRALFGSRLRAVGVGSAHVGESLMKFLRDTFEIGGPGGGCAIVSEGYGSTEFGVIWKDGYPAPGVEIKLVNQDQNGVGEILVRQVSNPDRCVAKVDPDGFYHTGDLGKLISEDPIRYSIVDRASASIKLANGKFFCPAPVEDKLTRLCPSLESCALIASPGDSAPFAVVLSRNKDTSRIVEEIRVAAQTCSLAPWQVPRQVFLDPGPWTYASGLRTALGKLKREKIAARWLDTVRCGENGAAALEEAVVRFLRSENEQAAMQSLGLKNKIVPLQFASIGGDSITAAKVAARLSNVRVEDLLSRCLWDMRDSRVAKIDWPTEVARAAGKPPGPKRSSGTRPLQQRPECILLTGSTGFVGRFLLQALVKERGDVEIVCIVRASSAHRVPNAKEGVTVLSGDVSRPNLGLDDLDLSRLRQFHVAIVLHNAAVVDHAQGYETLRPTNVDSVGHIVDMFSSETASLPRIVFISTTSAVPQGFRAEQVVRPQAADLAKNGYSQSKLIAENGLARAVKEGRVHSALILRLGLVGIHSTCGQGNVNDWFHLVLSAIWSSRSIPRGLLEHEMSSYPVDLLARDIAWIIRQNSFPKGDVTVMHMDGKARGIPPSRQFADAIDALQSHAGYSFSENVDYSEWRESLTGDAMRALLVVPKAGSVIPLHSKERTLDRTNLTTLVPPLPLAAHHTLPWTNWSKERSNQPLFRN